LHSVGIEDILHFLGKAKANLGSMLGTIDKSERWEQRHLRSALFTTLQHSEVGFCGGSVTAGLQDITSSKLTLQNE